MLIPDLKATKDINLTVLYFERSVESAEYALREAKTEEEKKEAREVVEAAKKVLEEFKSNGEDPIVTIGYLPPQKMTELRNEGFINARDAGEINPSTISADFLHRTASMSRQYLRWGVRGHKNLSDVPFETEKEVLGPREFDVASWDTVGIYELMSNGLYFNWLANEVIKFNNLDDSKKKQSSQQSGTSPQNSTVRFAKASPNLGKQEDAENPEE